MRTTFKKIFCLLACSIASFCFSSCGEDDGPDPDIIWDNPYNQTCRKSAPDSGGHFYIPKMVSQPGKAFFGFKKWLPNPGEHFLRVGSRSQPGRTLPTPWKRGFQIIVVR